MKSRIEIIYRKTADNLFLIKKIEMLDNDEISAKFGAEVARIYKNPCWKYNNGIAEISNFRDEENCHHDSIRQGQQIDRKDFHAFIDFLTKKGKELSEIRKRVRKAEEAPDICVMI